MQSVNVTVVKDERPYLSEGFTSYFSFISFDFKKLDKKRT